MCFYIIFSFGIVRYWAKQVAKCLEIPIEETTLENL